MAVTRCLFGAVLIVSLLFAVACEEKHDEAADAAFLEAKTAEWQEAFNSGNREAITDMMSDRAKLLPPNAEAVEGKSAISEYWKNWPEDLQAELTLDEVKGDKNIAYKVGTYVVKDSSGAVVDRGKYLELWRRIDGEWKMHRDIWNSSMPAPEAPTEEMEPATDA